jgi:hypothetical protein
MKIQMYTAAGGRIVCLRCVAVSTQTKQQCGRPALRTSKTQKCQFHGGRSTGPKTNEGRKRIATANTKHGRYSKEAKVKLAKELVVLYQLEDAMNLIGMSKSSKTRGRKPNGYIPVRKLEDIRLILKP